MPAKEDTTCASIPVRDDVDVGEELEVDSDALCTALLAEGHCGGSPADLHEDMPGSGPEECITCLRAVLLFVNCVLLGASLAAFVVAVAVRTGGLGETVTTVATRSLLAELCPVCVSGYDWFIGLSGALAFFFLLGFVALLLDSRCCHILYLCTCSVALFSLVAFVGVYKVMAEEDRLKLGTVWDASIESGSTFACDLQQQFACSGWSGLCHTEETFATTEDEFRPWRPRTVSGFAPGSQDRELNGASRGAPEADRDDGHWREGRVPLGVATYPDVILEVYGNCPMTYRLRLATPNGPHLDPNDGPHPRPPPPPPPPHYTSTSGHRCPSCPRDVQSLINLFTVTCADAVPRRLAQAHNIVSAAAVVLGTTILLAMLVTLHLSSQEVPRELVLEEGRHIAV